MCRPLLVLGGLPGGLRGCEEADTQRRPLGGIAVWLFPPRRGQMWYPQHHTQDHGGKRGSGCAEKLENEMGDENGGLCGEKVSVD